MSNISVHNLAESFQVGSVHYNWQGIGTPKNAGARDAFLSSEYVVLMKPETFLALATPTLFPTARGLSAIMKEAAEICPPFLRIYLNDNDEKLHPRIIGHEGRNRARAASMIDGDNALIPVFIATNRSISPELFQTLANGIWRENKGRKLSGELFDTFFYDEQEWSVPRGKEASLD